MKTSLKMKTILRMKTVLTTKSICDTKTYLKTQTILKYLVVTKESNDAKEVDISMLVERPIIDQFAERWPELKDSRDIVEWTYDVSQNSGSPSGAWSLRSSLHKNTTENRDETFLDDGELFHNSLSYFISIRSSYLSMRRDGHLVVETYSPFRFSHQFRLCQDILVPLTLSNFILHTSSGYKKWWNHIHGKYLDDGVNALITSAHPPPPKSKVVQPIHGKSNNNKDIQLPKVHVVNTISKSVNHNIQSKESQGVTTKLKKPPPRAPSVERSLEVHDAFEGGTNPVLEEMSDDNDSDHHWNRTKRPKLTIPSNPNSLRGITSASENLEGAKD
nr:hypothetical protein CFP56_68255 [Quercus suber]